MVLVTHNNYINDTNCVHYFASMVRLLSELLLVAMLADSRLRQPDIINMPPTAATIAPPPQGNASPVAACDAGTANRKGEGGLTA